MPTAVIDGNYMKPTEFLYWLGPFVSCHDLCGTQIKRTATRIYQRDTNRAKGT